MPSLEQYMTRVNIEEGILGVATCTGSRRHLTYPQQLYHELALAKSAVPAGCTRASRQSQWFGYVSNLEKRIREQTGSTSLATPEQFRSRARNALQICVYKLGDGTRGHLK